MAQRAPQDVLSECLERWEQGEGSVDEVLAQHPALRDDLEPLLALAADLRALPPLRAPSRLREDPLWRRAPSRTARPAPSEHPRHRPLPLWAAVHRERAGRPAGPRWPRQAVVSGLGRLAAGVGGAALALLVAGTFATSATSLPDQPLYPMKRLVEDAQLVIAPADSRLELHMQRAQERMKETREMADRDRADVVASLAAEYVREVDAVRSELQADRVRTLEPERVGRVVTSLEANEHALGALAERVPEPARPAVARAVEASRPEAVTPAVAPADVAPPAARVPAAVVPQFGASNPARAVEPGQRGTAQQVTESQSGPAASPTPPQVRVPSGAPSILPTPTSGVGAPGGSRTTTSAGAAASPATTDASKPDKETAPAAAAPVAPSFGQGAAAGQSASPATGGAATTSGASSGASGAATTASGAAAGPGSAAAPAPSAGGSGFQILPAIGPSPAPAESPAARPAAAPAAPREPVSAAPSVAPAGSTQRATP